MTSYIHYLFSLLSTILGIMPAICLVIYIFCKFSFTILSFARI
nr:MAG TPA: hypothetical protein [Caudoviricetes sp.]